MLELAVRIKAARRVYVIGNGGSYANAMHIVNDLLSCGVRAFTMDPATLTAFANDHGYYKAFARWIETVGEAGDMLIALSGSGKSPNILLAVEAAEKLGMDVHRELGAAQGFDMQAAEERQIWLGHEVMRCLRQK
jgi:D-sedoheptulose 7-phosphate isomerase